MKKIAAILKIEIFNIFYFIFYFLPGYYLSNKLRGWFMGLFLKEKGKKLTLNREVIFEVPKNISIGNNVHINARCWFSGGGNLTIGDNVLIGPHVIIHTANHNFENRLITIDKQGHTLKPVVIKNDVWLGANCTILPGVTINEGCVIGAGSVVTKDTEPFGIYVGVPAKKIKERT